MRILIVKTSALGDIIQSFPVVEFLKLHYPQATIHFALLKENQELSKAHPLIDETLVFPRKNFILYLFSKGFLLLRRKKYDLVFDLQGNIRSGLITFLAKSSKKIGFAKNSVAEWPNLLATNCRFEVDKKQNIRHQYLSLVQNLLQLPIKDFDPFQRRLLDLSFEEQKQLKNLKPFFNPIFQNGQTVQKILIAPFARWPSKTLNFKLLVSFLKQLQAKRPVHFFFLQGSFKERSESYALASHFKKKATVLEKMSLPLVQHLMDQMDLVIGMDSCPLHLAILAGLPAVGFFGPTRASVYGSERYNFLTLEGVCLKEKELMGNYSIGKEKLAPFQKRCQHLRDCSGRCIDRAVSLAAVEKVAAILEEKASV